MSLLLVWGLLAAAPAQAQDYSALGASYLFLGLPDFSVSSAFAAHQPVMAHGATLTYARGDRDSHWRAGLAFGGTTIPEGWWQATGAAAESAVWVDYQVGFLGAFGAWSWRFVLWRELIFSPSVGLGLAGVLGDVTATEAIPGCTEPVTECGHWRNATRHPVEFSYRVMPLVIATGRLSWEFSERLDLGIETGIFNLPFVGLFANYAL